MHSNYISNSDTNKGVVEHETEAQKQKKTTVNKEQSPSLPERGPPLPQRGPPAVKPSNFKFDTRNENKIESLKNLPLIVDDQEEETRNTNVIKPIYLNLIVPQLPSVSSTTTELSAGRTSLATSVDIDKTPTVDMHSRDSDSETEASGAGPVLTETELSDWTADDCISENFLDMEFVLNSNNGTIKRSKKGKKLAMSTKLPSTCEIAAEITTNTPVPELESILNRIDIDDIEFMDTGSEGSCVEVLSATNTALLGNRGYMTFVEAVAPITPGRTTKLPSGNSRATEVSNPLTKKCDQMLGIDYIEQGSYILQDEIKTPVNESSQLCSMATLERAHTLGACTLTESLTDSSTLNDLDDDSICAVMLNSQMQLSAVMKTTTDESETLTVVTSPLDSPSTRAQDKITAALIYGNACEAGDRSTPSSSDKHPKTSQSTGTTSSNSTSSCKATPTHRSSQELSPIKAANSLSSPDVSLVSVNLHKKTPTEELSYEGYVRALQQKIVQISSGRDSLDSRKQRRKSSKGESPAMTIFNLSTQTVIETPAIPKVQLGSNDNLAEASSNQKVHNKVPEIPTLTRKLEEITKERTKQKDLIHDLVMDKLQSKKQLNAEKRLQRSRQRSIMATGYANGSSLIPTPKISAASTISETNYTSQAHYHISTASTAGNEAAAENRIMTTVDSAFNEKNPLQLSLNYVTAYGMPTLPTSTTAYKQRPLSEHFDPDHALEKNKLNRSPSSHNFSWSPKTKPRTKFDSFSAAITAPHPPASNNRGYAVVATPAFQATSLPVSSENVRSQPCAHARLVHNSVLVVSPEEKMQLLRKRLHFEHLNNTKTVAAIADMSQIYTAKPAIAIDSCPLDDRSRKMSASKSVNDLAYLASNHQPVTTTDDSSHAKEVTISDFTSDPNLLQSSIVAQETNNHPKTNTNRRKDPERRRSLIQSLSSLFHKSSFSSSSNSGRHKHAGVGASSADNPPQIGGPDNGGNNNATSSKVATSADSNDETFSHFRLSPKSKEKWKEGDVWHACLATTFPTPSGKTKRSNSQDCILSDPHYSKLQQHLSHQHLHQHHNRQNNTVNRTSASRPQQHTNNNSSCNKISSSSAGTTISSSIPQLFLHRPSATYLLANSVDELVPPPIPPLPLNYQRSDDESYANESRDQKKQRAISKAVRQAELKRLRIAQEIRREQEEIEVQLKELEARGVLIEKALRGEDQPVENNLATESIYNNIGNNDDRLLKELLEIWRNITELKKRDEELHIREQELQLEHRHAQLKEELNLRLSNNKLEKSSSDVAAEGAILNEMLEIVARRAALRPDSSAVSMTSGGNNVTLATREQSLDNEESNV